MPMLFWSIANLQFCASPCPANWLSYEIYLRHICTLFYSFDIVYWTRLSKLLCAEHQVLVEYLLQWQIFIYIREKYFCDSVHLRKSGDNPCGLSKSDTHLHLNLRVSLCAVNYFPCISFILPRKDITCCFLPLLLTYLAYDPWRSILVGKIGIIL